MEIDEEMPTQETSTVVKDVISLQISLPHMLDLALGTPEIGAVNFNILHNFLHVLLQQINLQATKVEYRGESANRIKTMVTTRKPEPALHLQEYSITDGIGKVSQRIREDDGIDVEIFTEDTQLPADQDLKVTKSVTQQVGPGKDSEAQKIIFVEPVVNGSTPTGLAFKQLEQSIKELQQQFQVLKELAATPEIIERVKGRLTDPVTDVWQFINIDKRLDACEQGIDKLTTMVQDMMKGDVGVAVTADTLPFSTKLNELENKVSKMEYKFTNLQKLVDILIESVQPTADNMDVAAAVEAAAIDEAETAVPLPEKEETNRKIPKITADVLAAQRQLADGDDIAEIRRDTASLKTDVAEIQQELRDINEKIAQGEIPTKATIVDKLSPPEPPEDKRRLGEVSDAVDMEEYLEAVRNVEATYEKALHDIIERVEILEKEVAYMVDKVESMQAAAADKDINELVAKIQEIQADMEGLGRTADRLLDDKESREAHLNALLEQIELLKTIKADKEDLEDALADKADAQAVKRKVSHDQFDAACDDLARGLEEAVDKLNKQELIWQQALDEVQNEIAGKVDKIEMTPLRDFVNNRLKSLQEKLKSMAEMTRESEAAGTKKLLRDVQCISCDKDVVMKREEICGVRAEPLPCTASMKPYLTYQLDQVRKQQRRLPYSRNMIQFEAVIQEEVRKTKKVKEEMLVKTPRDHLSNRYCGGSHTVTTPQQRVMRMGHFLNQWGPEVIQLTDGLVRGKDGQMYRSRLMPDKLEICEPACWQSQISDETRSQVSQECAPTVSAAPRKFLQSRRNSVGSQKRATRKVSKEPKVTEPPEEKPIAEERQVTSPQEIDDRLLIAPIETQNEIIKYEADETTEEKYKFE